MVKTPYDLANPPVFWRCSENIRTRLVWTKKISTPQLADAADPEARLLEEERDVKHQHEGDRRRAEKVQVGAVRRQRGGRGRAGRAGSVHGPDAEPKHRSSMLPSAGE